MSKGQVIGGSEKFRADLQHSMQSRVVLYTSAFFFVAIVDIPVYKSWIQPLHVLFSLYSEFKNSQVSNPRQAQVTQLEAKDIQSLNLALLHSLYLWRANKQ